MDICIKKECVFPYAHPEHEYSTYSMSRIIEFLKSNVYRVETDEDLLEILAIEAMNRIKPSAPPPIESRSEPVSRIDFGKSVSERMIEFTAGANIREGMRMTVDRSTGMLIPLIREEDDSARSPIDWSGRSGG